jgi:antitoxin (DNA-binding transcriptional repressor) of toxin-antitoxin stability system
MVVRSLGELAVMPAMPIHEVQAKLAEVIHGLAPGEQLTITEHDQPVARLVSLPSQPGHRRLGTMQGSVTYMAPAFDAPLDDFREYMQ